jgi:hypothetical protein
MDADQQNSPKAFTIDWKYGTAPVLPFLPFNQDLNRYTLIVQNLKSAKAKITWGDQSREFTSAELSQGINLAAEFLKNPFVQQFAAVEKAVSAKQDFEEQFITHYLLGEAKFLQILPTKAASLKNVEDGYREIRTALADGCRKAVIPITHTITIQDE